MPINQFLPFAIEDDANVMSQTDYDALTARQSGFEMGVASSRQLNKVWRQSSTISSVLSQFICNHQTDDVLDNGEIPTLLTQFEAALINMFLPVETIISSFDPDFNPNLKYPGTTWVLHAQGKVAVGLSTQTFDPEWTKNIGTKFGEFDHQLTTDELPVFSLNYPNQWAGTNPPNVVEVYSYDDIGWAKDGAADTSVLQHTNSVGADLPHNNVQPSIVEARWRRTA